MRVVWIFVLLTCSVQAQVSGGPFAISQSAVAGGGSTSSSGPFTVEGTAGQSAAGGPLQSGPFALWDGFWTPAPLAPTAANVSISGRVLTADGQGIPRAYVTLMGPDGVSHLAYCNSFGHYHFSEVTAGDVYIVTVTSRRYVFPQPTRVVNVVDEVVGLDFVAAP